MTGDDFLIGRSIPKRAVSSRSGIAVPRDLVVHARRRDEVDVSIGIEIRRRERRGAKGGVRDQNGRGKRSVAQVSIPGNLAVPQGSGSEIRKTVAIKICRHNRRRKWLAGAENQLLREGNGGACGFTRERRKGHNSKHHTEERSGRRHRAESNVGERRQDSLKSAFRT